METIKIKIIFINSMNSISPYSILSYLLNKRNLIFLEMLIQLNKEMLNCHYRLSHLCNEINNYK